MLACPVSYLLLLFLVLIQASSTSLAGRPYAARWILMLRLIVAAAACPDSGRSVLLQPAAGFTEFSGLKNANALRCGRQEQTLASRVATQATTVSSGTLSFTYR